MWHESRRLWSWLIFDVSQKPAVDRTQIGGTLAGMALAQFPELLNLPKRQKLKLADELWRAAVDDRRPVSAADRALLDSRWKAYRSGKAERITPSELEKRVSRR